MPAWAGLCACFVSFPETMIHPRMGFMPLLLLTGLTCASLTKSIVEFLPMPSVADGSLLGAKGRGARRDGRMSVRDASMVDANTL